MADIAQHPSWLALVAAKLARRRARAAKIASAAHDRAVDRAQLGYLDFLLALPFARSPDSLVIHAQGTAWANRLREALRG